MPGRRLIVPVTTALMVALIALSLHTLSTARGSDGGEMLPSAFTSPIEPRSIVGTVYEDVDGDGIQDPSESGISGVTVRLGGVITSTTPVDITDPDGGYAFCMLWSGDYTVTAVAPSGYANTTPESQLAHVPGPGPDIEINFGYRRVTYLPLIAQDYP